MRAALCVRGAAVSSGAKLSLAVGGRRLLPNPAIMTAIPGILHAYGGEAQVNGRRSFGRLRHRGVKYRRAQFVLPQDWSHLQARGGDFVAAAAAVQTVLLLPELYTGRNGEGLEATTAANTLWQTFILLCGGALGFHVSSSCCARF